ncbi:MAG: YmdB family metallophosphoesterase [Nitrospira sp.]
MRPANYPRASLEMAAWSSRRRAENGSRSSQLMGRVYMPTLDCPFHAAKREVSRLKRETSAIIVDMHAETTSEKMAMGHFLDGEVTAVVGTHTHVQTADEQILPKGTAYITDIGMTGPLHSVIGVKKELAIEKFLTGMPKRFEGRLRAFGVLCRLARTGCALGQGAWRSNGFARSIKQSVTQCFTCR